MMRWIGTVLVIAFVARAAPAQERKTEFVFLVTADGIRHQELFSGADPALVTENAKESSGIEDVEAVRRAYWSEDAVTRREKLMPFFWKELSAEGIVLGNRSRGSRVKAKNSHLFSYPGYAEILNGAPLPSIDSNDAVFSPRKTVLEYIREELGLERHQVACFASWRVFDWITRQSESTIFSNAGYEAVPEALATEGMSIFHRLQMQMMTPWDSTRHDAMTFGLAMEYIRAHEPRVFYLAAGETDDWAHERRYDRTLHGIQLFDDALRELWTYLQSTEPYRGRSTLIVTTDHGRGRNPDDWTSHGKDVPGADEIWIGVFGPDTPKVGEATSTGEHYQSQIAATMLELLGLDYRSFNPSADAPIAEAFVQVEAEVR
ncbi:MAG: hypothetical protein E2P02_19845 [Acidobacteria bacterium]|nr:MAG: hypothetical protein E2P02_19845 [Acidobacteriota bacterium]